MSGPEMVRKEVVMTIADLSHDEKLALVALLEAVAMANTTVTEGEGKGIAAVAESIGDEAYRALLDEVERRFTDTEALKSFLSTIDNKDARNLIYGTVWEASMSDPGRVTSEIDLVNWLGKAWEIPTPG
jgi:uncharacterized tellurite resistance protein B-like protein